MLTVNRLTGGTGVFTWPSDSSFHAPAITRLNSGVRVVDSSSTRDITAHTPTGSAVVTPGTPGATSAANTVTAGYISRPEVRAFIDEMVTKHGFNRATLIRLFRGVKKQDSVLASISRPAESFTWKRYRPIFMTEARVQAALRFEKTNRATLQRAEQVYGVPKEVILGIIGVETLYGQNTGNIKVLDSLTTLAFDYPKRAKFFGSELEQFLLLSREQGWKPAEITGSYAGAVGKSQFISSSYRHYAVDFDHDGDRDLWSNADAIGSVANYFREHKWHTGQPVVVRAQATGSAFAEHANTGTKPDVDLTVLAGKGVSLNTTAGTETRGTLLELQGADGKEHWVGLHNFYVITRYNRSPLYAMAVHQLSQEIASRLAH